MRSKRQVTRRKAEELIVDCIEDESEEEPENVLANVDYRKCKKKKKKRVIQSPAPRISPIDILLSRIQPSIEQRALLTDRHFACLMEKPSQTSLSVPENVAEAKKSKDLRKKKTRRKKREKDDENKGEDKKVEEDENKISRSEVEEESRKDEFEEEAEGAEETKDDKSPDRDKRKAKKTSKRKKDKFWCKEVKKEMKYKMDEKSDSECSSICSFDSEVCLAGLALTVEDKRSIEENRQRVLASDKKHMV